MDKEFLAQSLVGVGSVGNYAYLRIPADQVRHLVDSAFPAFAKNAAADIASGHGHRWVAGHDLLLDVPRTFVHDGWSAGWRHLGHILFTDFPTKSGIPIPGFSQSGFGEYLVNHWHISPDYLCINAVDGAVGVFACTEGFCDLLMVCASATRMTPQLFFDTFIEGCAEGVLGAHTANPLLLVAGLEQIAAGVVSSAYTITHPDWYVAPSAFFGGALTGGIVGFAISKFIFNRSTEVSLQNAARSCAVSALFTIQAGFGIAALCGFVGMGLGRFIADRDNQQMIRYCQISKQDLEIIVNAYASIFPAIGFDGRLCGEGWPLEIGTTTAPWGLQIGQGENQSFGLEFPLETFARCSHHTDIPPPNVGRLITLHADNFTHVMSMNIPE